MAVRKRKAGRNGAGVLMDLTPTKASKIPNLYATENVEEDDKIICVHFFCKSCDWYATEYDPKTELFFGYVNLGDPENAEWGYFSQADLESVSFWGGMMGVERDLHWRPTKFSKVKQRLERLAMA